MKKYLLIIGIASAMFAACSSSEEVLTQNTQEPIDEENVTREDLMGDIPIEFADITGSATVEQTRGSASVGDAFKSGTMGIYCIGAKKINIAAEDPKLSGSSTALGKILSLWLENVSAHVEPTTDNKGYIVWDNPYEKHYYPQKDWYAYKFAAYHPRTEYIAKTSQAVAAYIPIDGNDDVFATIAEGPRVSIGADDSKAYSQKYFEAVGANNITAYHRPYFNFKHMTSRLKFKVKLKDDFDCDRELHVDSICFSDFPNIMKIALAKFDNGDLINNWYSYGFVTNYSDYMPESLKADLPKKTIIVSGKETEACVVNGLFWLREPDDSSIGEKVNGQYKYVVNKDDYIDVGDCIMMPPVYKDHTKSTIKLEVYLADNYGNKFTTVQPIEISAPDKDPSDPDDVGGWKSGKSYTIKVSIGGSIFFMDQTRGQMSGHLDGYTEESVIDVSN